MHNSLTLRSHVTQTVNRVFSRAIISSCVLSMLSAPETTRLPEITSNTRKSITFYEYYIK